MRAALAEKAILNPGEAIQLYDMSARRFYRLIQGRKRLPFVALYNKRKLIIRSEFDKYLEQHPEEKERLRNGTRSVMASTTRQYTFFSTPACGFQNSVG